MSGLASKKTKPALPDLSRLLPSKARAKLREYILERLEFEGWTFDFARPKYRFIDAIGELYGDNWANSLEIHNAYNDSLAEFERKYPLEWDSATRRYLRKL